MPSEQEQSVEQPSYLRCTKTASKDFVVGTIYEVHSYENGTAWLATESEAKCLPMPHDGHAFVPHDPWAKYRASQDEAARTPTPDAVNADKAVAVDAEAIQRTFDNACAELAADAVRSAFFVSVSGGEKPYRYHLRLAYPSMDAMHKAEDALKALASHPRFQSLATRLATPAPDKALMPEAAVGEVLPRPYPNATAEGMKYSECFVFDDGSLTVRTSGPWISPGSGWLCFPQDALEPEQDQETGKDYWIANLANSEMIFLRDTLNKIFPATPTPVEEREKGATGDQVEDAIAASLAQAKEEGADREDLSHHHVAFSYFRTHLAALAATNAGQVEAYGHDWWLAVAKYAGQHGVRYRTNSALLAFLDAVAALTNDQAKSEVGHG